jgi:hypothetical protein
VGLAFPPGRIVEYGVVLNNEVNVSLLARIDPMLVLERHAHTADVRNSAVHDRVGADHGVRRPCRNPDGSVANSESESESWQEHGNSSRPVTHESDM